MAIERVTVIGGGTMGNGIAHTCAQAGLAARLVDVSPQVLERALETIAKNLDRQVKKGVLTQDASAATLARIETGTQVDVAVTDADLVIEAVPEKVELKRELFAALDRAAPPPAILASNTSSISITEIASHTRR